EPPRPAGDRIRVVVVRQLVVRKGLRPLLAARPAAPQPCAGLDVRVLGEGALRPEIAADIGQPAPRGRPAAALGHDSCDGVAGALLALGAVGFAVRSPRGVAALFLVLAGVTPDVLRAVGAGPVSLSFWWTALLVGVSAAYVAVAATTPRGVVLPVEARWAVALAGLALFTLAWSPARDVGARTWVQLVAPVALGLMILNLPRTAPDGLSFATSSGYVPSMLT